MFLELAFVVIVFILGGVMFIYSLLGFIGYLTKGRVLGKFLHTFYKHHDPGKNSITCYHSNLMSNCKYCGKRIMKVGKNWFTLEQNNRKEKK